MQQPCRRRAIYAMRAQDAQAATVSNLETLEQEQNNNKVCPFREIDKDVKATERRSRKRAIISN
jgi:hypothetical protein